MAGEMYGQSPYMTPPSYPSQPYTPTPSYQPSYGSNLSQYYQDRLANMPNLSNYGYQPQQPYQQQQPPAQYRPPAPPPGPTLTIRSSTNIDEVRATPIDLMTINVFVNLASNEIYMSRIDDKGLKDIQTYKLFDDTGNGEQPVATAAPVPAIDLSEIYNRFDRLEGLLSPATTANAKKTPANKEATANA